MDFYLVNILILFIHILAYLYFRTGVDNYLKLIRKSKSYIKKNKKGIINYWLYRQFFIQKDVKLLFFINLFLIVILCLYSCFSFFFAWSYIMHIPVTVLSLVSGAADIPAIAIAMACSNQVQYGTAAVFFKVSRSSSRKIQITSFADWLICLLPLALSTLFSLKYYGLIF